MSATLPRRAFLGAELPGDHEAFTAVGVRVAAVAPDSMAARAGVIAGDVLVSVAGLPVRDLRELARALRAAGTAPTTALAFERAGARHVADVPTVPFPHDGACEELAVDGATLRTFATGTGPRILIVQGIACESVEDAPYADLAAAWTRAGYTVVRFDKRGVGDSTGEPSDFATELADARAVAERYRPDVIFGHSIGGIIAAQLHARALIVYGTPVTPWLECIGGTDEIRELARAGKLAGRCAAYHEQLDALDLAELWPAVRVPVLVVRGEYDWVVSAADQARIATLASSGELLDVPAIDHVFGIHADHDASRRDYGAGAIDDRVARATLPWLDRILSRA